MCKSRIPHGVRGLKFCAMALIYNLNRRIPHGVRGLKFAETLTEPYLLPSHPSRGAWIEIWLYNKGRNKEGRRIPHGVRGLKFDHVLRCCSVVAVASLTGCVD